MHIEPLAYRMRPQHIDDLIGQEAIIGSQTPLYQLVTKGHIPSLILYGPPGVGKTSLAHAIAQTGSLPFIALNATTCGKKEIEQVVQDARIQGKVLLFLDEIHRFNKLQQDTLLPHVENGSIVLIGATTENPFHDVNPAIRSRCDDIIQLQRLTTDAIVQLLQKALLDQERGLGKQTITISTRQLTKVAEAATGDARKALNILDAVVKASDEETEPIQIEDQLLVPFLKRAGLASDKKGSNFYNLLSALQKSIRGSDADAGIYYLAYLLEAGDLIAVCRRLLVIAYEDIGLAEPTIGPQVVAATDAALRLGMPEARIPLAQVVISMCLAHKSNSAYLAIDKALTQIRKGEQGDIPLHLRDTHYEGAQALGHKGYQYPHHSPIGTFGGWVNQQYLPDSVQNQQYYQPVLAGQEQQLANIHKRLLSFKKGGKKTP